MKWAISVVLVLAGTGIAAAYPQFQMSRDQTCTGCHISPAGGGMLNENGYGVAESISQFGTAPETFYNEKLTSGRVQIGGDLRGAFGFLKYGGPEDTAIYPFPMQIEVYLHAKLGGGLSFHGVGGFRPAQEGHVNIDEMGTPVEPGARLITYFWSREHYLMFQSKPDENFGTYVRAGRFMPVFGLRFAEHPMYTRRFGGSQLYSDTYGISVSQVAQKFEVHATGFVEDYLLDPVEHANGAALYGEVRPSETLSIGGGVLYKSFTNGEFLLSDKLDNDSREFRIALTNKLYLSGPDLLFQTELQFVNMLVDKTNRSIDSQTGGAPKQLLGSLVVSKMFANFLLLDVGLGHFDSNTRIHGVDRECVDLNLHWFTTSHLELILNTRYEINGFGKTEPGLYTLLQAHYRL